MNKLFQCTLTFIFALVIGNAFGYNPTATPPDTITSLADKTTAAYYIEEGKTLYGVGKIKEALVKFREAGIKDPNSWRAAYWISQCHYKMDNFGYALKYANEAITKGGTEKVNDEVYFTLGCAHHRMGNLDSALINYTIANERLSKSRSNVLLISHLIDEVKFAQEQLKTEAKYTRVRLKGDINSGFDDYNGILMPDGKTIYFTSRRSNTTGGGMNPDDERFFEDVYIATWDPIMGAWEDVNNRHGKLNSNGFDALDYLSPDGMYGVMTLNSTETEEKTPTRGSDICEIKKNTKGVWNRPRIIDNKTINTSWFEGSATLTADGNTMYFVTDRKGEKSSTDIYVVEKVGKAWGEAQPLPMTINTKGRETTPFITPDGRYLFFSSDGHLGMGGLDIYVVENQGGVWGTPVNLGNGINSVNNDTHFSYNIELKKALLSCYEIIGNKSSIDIYQVDMTDFVFPK